MIIAIILAFVIAAALIGREVRRDRRQRRHREEGQRKALDAYKKRRDTIDRQGEL